MPRAKPASVQTKHPEAQPTIRPVSRFKLSDSVAAELEQLIKAGTYAPGDKLPSERTLSEEFGVGRSSMREALRALEAVGLVTIAHGLGVFVNEQLPARGELADFLVLKDCTIPELFEVRRALECAGAALAAKRITQAEMAQLEQILAASEGQRLSDAQYIEKDAELHLAIIHATRNNLLIRVYESTRHLFVEYSGRVIQLPGRRSSAQGGHAEIVAAIVARRPQVAQRAMSSHLEAVERDIVAYLDAAALRQEESDESSSAATAVGSYANKTPSPR